MEKGNIMTTRNAWANLIRWFGQPGRRRVARRQDFADHGTAFGLDLSLAPDVMNSTDLNPAHAAPWANQPKAGGNSGRSVMSAS
ncbi:MAG: hypothetical protein RL375_2702 [Pseudomonadota bacterium]|jgi:hypothetical protein